MKKKKIWIIIIIIIIVFILFTFSEYQKGTLIGTWGRNRTINWGWGF